jgi:DNA-binding LacI/PurR family transcriptional regulator
VSAINGVLEAIRARGLGEDNLSVVVLEPGEAEEEDDALDETYSNYLDETLPRRSVGRGRALLRRALLLEPRPTALLCYNDVAAVGVLLEAAQLGLLIPGEMAVAAANRSLVAELAPLSLTTCDTLPGKVAEAVLELLLDTVEGRCDEATVRGVSPVLRPGKSTVPNGVADRLSHPVG